MLGDADGELALGVGRAERVERLRGAIELVGLLMETASETVMSSAQLRLSRTREDTRRPLGRSRVVPPRAPHQDPFTPRPSTYGRQ